MFTVKVLNGNSGSPVKNAKVGIVIDDPSLGEMKHIYTDYDGEAHFKQSNCKGRVFVTVPWGYFQHSDHLYEGFLQRKIVVYIK